MLVLASSSRQRLTLLRQIGFEPELVVHPNVSECLQQGELPVRTAARLANAKAMQVAALHPHSAVIAADTTIACGRRLLPKAVDADEARRCLSLLSGRRHLVYTGIVVCVPGRIASRLVKTRVAFRRLERDEIEGYLASGEWQGKAGGYAIQGRAAAFVRWIGGSYSAVVGLPLCEAALLLRGLGIRCSAEAR